MVLLCYLISISTMLLVSIALLLPLLNTIQLLIIEHLSTNIIFKP